MASSDQTQIIEQSNAGLSLFPSLVLASIGNADSPFMEQAVAAVAKTLNGTSAALMQGVKGQWRCRAMVGKENPPTELLSETLDGEQFCNHGSWSAAPLSKPNASGMLIAVETAQPLSRPDLESVAAALRSSHDAARIGHLAAPSHEAT